MQKPIPVFMSEEEERQLWNEHGATENLDWDQAFRLIFPRLKSFTKTISLRMPESMLNQIRVLANKRDIPYQSLIRVFLQERIDDEFSRQSPS